MKCAQELTRKSDPKMEGFSRFCQLALISANIIALVKSVELTFSGAALLVLDPAWRSLLSNLSVTSYDLQPELEVTWAQILQLLAKFMLITGPVIFVVGVAGLCGAYRKSICWLACYLALLVVLITVILGLCATGIPSALMNPSSTWRPLSDFMLTSVVTLLATQGLMIFFTIVLMSALSKEEVQVHPDSDSKNSKLARPPPRSRR